MFDDYEGNSEDYSKLASGQFDHPRTSERSLRELSKRCYAHSGSRAVADQLDDAIMWLQTHRDELPTEIEGETGGRSGQADRYETTRGVYMMDDSSDLRAGDNQETAEEHLSSYPTMGEAAEAANLEDAGRASCYNTLESFATSKVDKWAVRKYGPYSPETMAYLQRKRGEAYKRYAERQAKRLRWLGMEEYDAIEKANERLREGVKLRKANAKANALPPLDQLEDAFAYCPEDGLLIRKESAGRAKAGDVVVLSKKGQVRVGGKLYYASRIAYALGKGVDPADLPVVCIDGDPTNLRLSNLTVQEYSNARTGSASQRDRATIESVYDARIKIDGEDITIGTYPTERQAQEARKLYVKSLEMGLL